jgi:PadR family transcriptional regulator, regulatory protein PadR
MGTELRLTTQTLKVLGTLLASGGDELAGADIGRAAELQSGTLYPILFRLERENWVVSRWEVENPQELGRPRRRLYKLTGLGARKSKAEFRNLTSAIGGLAWNTR